MRANGSIGIQNVRATAGSAGDRGLIQIQTVNGIGQAVLEGADLEARRIVMRAESIAVRGNSRLGAPKGKIHLEARSGDLLIHSSTLDLGVYNIDDLRAEAPWTILSVDPDTGAEVRGRVEDPPSIGLFAEKDVRITGGSLITASQDLSPILEEHPSLRRSDIRLTDTAGIVVVDAAQKLAVDSSSLSADASHNFAGNVVLRANGQGAGSSLSVRHSVLSAEGGAGSGDIRLNSSNGIDIVGSILRVSSHNRMGDPTTKQPFEGYAFTRGEITLANSSPDRPIDIRSSQLRSRQTFSGNFLLPLKFNGDVGGTFSDEWEWNNNDDLTGGGSLANTGGFITLISNGGIWIKDGSELDVSSQPPGGGPIEDVRGFIRLASGKGQQLLIGDDVRLNVQASPVSGEIHKLIFDKEPFPDDFWGPVTNQNLFLVEGRAQDRVLTLFEPLRNSIDNGKTVVVIGPDPSSPITIEVPDLGLPSSREPFKDFPVPPRDHWMTSGSASALTLALLPEGSAREVAALAAEVVEPLSEAKATQLFADEQQSASREVMTAMGLPMRQLRNLGIAPLQQLLRQSIDQPWRRGGQVASVDGYKPAILHLSLTPLPDSSLVQLNQILIPADGPVRGWQTRASGLKLKSAIETFQRRLSQFGDLEEASAPGAQLAFALLDPVMPEIQRLGINAVLLSLDRGLQGIPFAALPWGQGTLGEELALTVTPALALTDLAVPPPVAGRRTVLAGTGSFPNGLAPLPMARQELEQLARVHPSAKVMMDGQFQSRSLMEAASGGALDILHLATHAEFAPDRAGEALVYTSDGALSLKQIGQHLHGGGGGEIGLFVLNACRTAIGNEDQELGIAGLALQTGASSALGNLWYVDDAMSAAFSVQYHRALQRGLRKDQALQFTQGMFRRGEVKVRGEDLVTADGEVLITGLSRADQLRLMKNSNHPYFWAGTVLSGRPW
jgi:CHAT domain-containing protein